MVRVPLDLDVELKREADARGLSYQGAVREAIAQWLQKAEPQK